jgi:hypothetical protein
MQGKVMKCTLYENAIYGGNVDTIGITEIHSICHFLFCMRIRNYLNFDRYTWSSCEW